MKAGYKGYRSFQYVRPDIDYTAFKLARQVDRVEPYVVPLTPGEEARFKEFVDENIIISLHEHPTITPDNLEELMAYEREGREFTAFEALSRSCLDAIFDNMMDGTCVIHSRAGWKWEDVVHDIGMRCCDIAHQDFLIKAGRVEDIFRAKREGKIAWILCLESASPIENELDRIEILYGLGVRLLGICYSESNMLGSGLKEEGDGGLTSFGRQAVERMNRVGMAIDVSHAGDRTSLDTIEASEKPVFITHTGARSLWNMPRLKPDHVLQACAEKGGVIGIEAAPHTTVTRTHPRHSIDSFMEHFEYVRDLVGIDHVAFGPDTLYGDHAGLHAVFNKIMGVGQATSGEHIDRVPYVRGLENPTEAWGNIVRWLIKKGYSDTDMAKVLGTNILRVLREVWH